jgi:hypothetical protein
MIPSSLPSSVGALAILLSTAGCMASIGGGPVTAPGEEDATWVDAAPTNVQSYPHESYHGRDVYYVGGRWEYQTGGRWAAYRNEPQELESRRTSRAIPPPAREEHSERR